MMHYQRNVLDFVNTKPIVFKINIQSEQGKNGAHGQIKTELHFPYFVFACIWTQHLHLWFNWFSQKKNSYTYKQTSTSNWNLFACKWREAHKFCFCYCILIRVWLTYCLLFALRYVEFIITCLMPFIDAALFYFTLWTCQYTFITWELNWFSILQIVYT